MTFPTDLRELAKIEGLSNVSIKDLPQLYRADLEFASGKSEALDLILRSIPKHPEFQYVSIDSRSHMLMKDMYPCIPGWHCDDFYRATKDHQPSLETVLDAAPAVHYILILGDNSRTEFPVGDLVLPDPSSLSTDKPLYLHYDEIIDERNIEIKELEPETLYSFGPLCFHRGQAATKNGWRFFMRVTFSNHREPKNEVRYQTQVYTKQRVSW